MCIVELHVSLLPCRHRWYHLSRPCKPSANLANCVGKLAISGWEIKCDFCPYCAEWNLSGGEYRLLGNDKSHQASPLVAARPESRSSGLSRVESELSISDSQDKNRAPNARVDAYYNRPSSDSSNGDISYPSTPRDFDEDTTAAMSVSFSIPSDDSSEGQDGMRQSSISPLFKKVRKQSKRLSLSMFNAINPLACTFYNIPRTRMSASMLSS